MTAAWRLVPSDPWSQRTRSPALVLAILAHLSVLGALGLSALLRVVPVPTESVAPPAMLWVLLPPPPMEPDPLPPEEYVVQVPRGDTLTTPRLAADSAPAEALPDVPDPTLPATLGELDHLPIRGFGPPGDGGPGSPDGDPGGSGSRAGLPDAEDDSATPLTVGGRVTAPTLLHRVEPEYPIVARRSRLPGRVIVEAVIARDGTVENAVIVHATSRVFEEAALEAVRQWHYAPAHLDGRPVRVTFRVNVAFILE